MVHNPKPRLPDNGPGTPLLRAQASADPGGTSLHADATIQLAILLDPPRSPRRVPAAAASPQHHAGDADAAARGPIADHGPAAMLDGDKPVTKRELARLLRAFAHMIERFDVTENDTAQRRAPRKAKPPLASPSELTRARARAALRKLGTLP